LGALAGGCQTALQDQFVESRFHRVRLACALHALATTTPCNLERQDFPYAFRTWFGALCWKF
jgi:hypothetical protein